jgi:hypothetical protein
MMRFILLGISLLALSSSAAFIDRTRDDALNAYLPKKALKCERAVRRQNPSKYCKDCNQKATVGAADIVTVQIGGCGRSTSHLSTVAEFTAAGVYFAKPIQAPSFNVDAFQTESMRANSITPATGTSLVLGGADTTVTIPGDLIAGTIQSNTIAPATGTIVSISGDLTVGSVQANAIHPATGKSRAQSGNGDLFVGGQGTFTGGLQTSSVTPATGTSLVLGGAGTTVTIPGDLTVGKTLTYENLEIFIEGIKTDIIQPATPGATVRIPGSGKYSTAVGDQGECPMLILLSGFL